jgi:hypothetical protein
MEDADYLGTLLDMFDPAEPKAMMHHQSPLESSSVPSDPGQTFLNWVKEGILSHKLIINDSKAKVHT